MRTVGVRELKNRLSHYLRLVRTGERVLITNRGKEVAEVEGEAQRLLGLERGRR